MAATDVRERLLGAAEAELLEGGIAGLSLRAIARRAGVSHQAPGYHFVDRAGLLTSLAIRTHEALAAALEAARDALPADDAAGRLTATGRAYVRFSHERPALFTLLCRPELWRADAPELAAAGAASWGVLAGCVEEARAGGWGRGQPAEALALTCWASVHGVAVLARDGALRAAGGEPTPPGAVEDAAARAVTGVLTAGLA